MKIGIILSNKDKYSISAMFRLLKIPRSLVYYKSKNNKEKETAMINALIKNI